MRLMLFTRDVAVPEMLSQSRSPCGGWWSHSPFTTKVLYRPLRFAIFFCLNVNGRYSVDGPHLETKDMHMGASGIPQGEGPMDSKAVNVTTWNLEPEGKGWLFSKSS